MEGWSDRAWSEGEIRNPKAAGAEQCPHHHHELEWKRDVNLCFVAKAWSEDLSSLQAFGETEASGEQWLFGRSVHEGSDG